MENPPDLVEHLSISLRSAVILFYLAGFMSWLRKECPLHLGERYRQRGWASIQIGVVFFFSPVHAAMLLKLDMPKVVADFLVIGGMACLLVAAFCFQVAGFWARGSREMNIVKKVKRAVATNVLVLALCLLTGLLINGQD